MTGAGRVMGWPNTLSPHDAGAAIEGIWPSLCFASECLPELRRKATRLEWGRAALAQWRAEAEAVLGTPPALPHEPIGWRHDFYAPETAEHLLFDPRQGERFVDPWDGRVYDGAPAHAEAGPDAPPAPLARRRAWTLLLHERTYRLMHGLAVLYALTGDERYAAWVAEGMARAASVFARDDLRARNEARRHRALYFQPLYDAQVLLLLASAYDLTRGSPAYGEAGHRRVRRVIFEDAVPYQLAFLDGRAPQNMMCYAAAALATAGQVFDREDWRHPAYHHPRSGFFALLEHCLRPDAGGEVDGFWIEGTQFYHFYSLCPLIALYERLPPAERSESAGHRLSAMLEAPLLMADEGLRLPAFGDLGAPRHLNLRLYRHLYEYGAGRLDAPRFGPALAALYADGAPRRSLAAVAYGPDVVDDPRAAAARPWAPAALPASGIAFLRGTDQRTGHRFQVWLRAGPHGQGHDHPDKLSIGLHAAGEVLATDLGTAGYGLTEFTAYCRSTFAHNTLLVDERSQERVRETQLHFGGTWAAGVLHDAYPGVRLERRLALRPPLVLLEDLCQSEEAHRYAWVLHVYGSLAVHPVEPWELQGDGDPLPGSSHAAPVPALPPLPHDGPFAWLTNRRRGLSAGTLRADWRVRDGLWLRLVAAVAGEADGARGAFEWTAGQTPGNPIPDRRGTLVLRAPGRRLRFRVALEVHRGAPTLDALPDEEAFEEAFVPPRAPIPRSASPVNGT